MKLNPDAHIEEKAKEFQKQLKYVIESEVDWLLIMCWFIIEERENSDGRDS